MHQRLASTCSIVIGFRFLRVKHSEKDNINLAAEGFILMLILSFVAADGLGKVLFL